MSIANPSPVRSTPEDLPENGWSLARSAGSFLASNNRDKAVEALEEAWRTTNGQTWLLELREQILSTPPEEDLGRLAREIWSRLPGTRPSVGIVIANGIDQNLCRTTLDSATSDLTTVMFEFAETTSSGTVDWNAAVDRIDASVILRIEAGDRLSAGLIDRIAERFLFSGERNIVCAIPGWFGKNKLPEPGLTPLQILWHGGPPRWSAFTRELWLRTGGFDPSMGPLAERALWVKFLEAGASCEHLLFDRIDLARHPSPPIDPPWIRFLEEIRPVEEIRRRVGTLFLNEARIHLARNEDYQAIAPLRAAAAFLPNQNNVAAVLRSLEDSATPPDSEATLASASAYISLGQPDDAAKILERDIRVFPDRKELRHSLGWLLLQQDKQMEGAEVLRESARRFPDDRIARECLVELARNEGRPGEAEFWSREIEAADQKTLSPESSIPKPPSRQAGMGHRKDPQ